MESLVPPQTAAEALVRWDEVDHYYSFEDEAASFAELCAAANAVLELANAEGVPLEDLVPDEQGRELLVYQAEQHRRTRDDGN